MKASSSRRGTDSCLSKALIFNTPEKVVTTILRIAQFTKEHTKNARQSSKGQHQKEQARKQEDYGGEKGDISRRPPNKKPNGWKVPWSPKPATN